WRLRLVGFPVSPRDYRGLPAFASLSLAGSDGGGKLQSEQNLKKIYGISEVPLEGEQIHYCHTGNRAALGWFVAHEILGNSQARLYDGSTEVWAADPSLPMQQRVDLSH
ncbi:MAG: hypothetical protein ABW068_14400, partial [Candidatus Thiodiazotropha sp.]